MIRILLFVLFLAAYVFFAVVLPGSMKKLQSDTLAGKNFLSSEILLLEGVAMFFGLLYLLSGFWSTKLVLLILVTSHLGALVAWILNLMLASQSEQGGVRILWASNEIAMNHTIAMASLGGLVALPAYAYPIVAGVIFFRHPWGTTVLQVQEVKCTLLLLSLSGYLLNLIVPALILSSENLDEDTRQRSFVNQTVGLMPVAIYIAIAVWAFGLNGTPLTVSVLGFPAHTLAPRTLLLLLGLFAGSTLIPFVIGVQLARRKNLRFAEQQKDFLTSLERILEAPNADAYFEKLEELRGAIASAQSSLVGADRFLTYEKQIRESPEGIEPSEKPLADAIEKHRDLDPRLSFLDDLGKLLHEIDEVEADLKKRAPAAVEAAALQWSGKYKGWKEEVSKDLDADSSKKSLVTAGAGTLLSSLILALLSDMAQTAWNWIAQTHP
jgi:hypothetical protein